MSYDILLGLWLQVQKEKILSLLHSCICQLQAELLDALEHPKNC